MASFQSLCFGMKVRKTDSSFVPSQKRPSVAASSPPKKRSKKTVASKATSSTKSLDELFGGLTGCRKFQNDQEICSVTLHQDDVNSGDDEANDLSDNSEEEEPFFDFIDRSATDKVENLSDQEDAEPSKIQLYSGAEITDGISQTKRKSKKKRKKTEAQRLAQIKQEEVNRFRNENNIHVQGNDVTEPIATFDDLTTRFELNKRLIANIQTIGYKMPTAIQMQAIPLLLEKREILASAPTGSGKTAAFLIPIVHCLVGPKDVGYRAVIVAPTRELAKQTFFEFERLSSGLNLRAHLLEDVPKVIKKFRANPAVSSKYDVLVTTPNRLVFLLQSKPAVVELKTVEWLVIDESDKLFEAHADGGFRDQLAVIYKACSNPGVRRALFSATFATEVEDWCKLNLNDVVQVSIGAKNAATSTIDQKLIFVGNETGKLTALRQIFHQSKQKAKELVRSLQSENVHCDVIHSDRPQHERDQVVNDFRSGKIWTLVATEVLGRGIDFKGVNLVVNYDFPLSSISYIHRIGRTGRAGSRGQAVTLFTEKDSSNLRSIANVMRRSGCDVPEYMLQLKSSSGSGLKRLKREVLARRSKRTEKLKPKTDGKSLEGVQKKKNLAQTSKKRHHQK